MKRVSSTIIGLLLCALLTSGLFASACSEPSPENSSSAGNSLSASGSPSSGQGSSGSSWSAAAPGSEIRIAYLNAEDFNSDKDAGTGTYGVVADLILTNAIDIMLFCENSPWDARMLGEALSARGISMTHRITTSNTSNPEDDGIFDDEISLWSRFAITDFSQVLRGYYLDPVSNTSVNAPRYILRACVDVGGRSFWFYGGHLKATSTATLADDIKRRRAQAHALENYIKANHNPVTDYIVILGDMNTTERPGDTSEAVPDFDDAGTLGRLTLKSDNPGNTANDFTAVNATHLPMPGGYTWASYTGTWQSLLDHIILSPALYARYVPGSVAILFKGIEPRISDHYPVTLKISLE